MLCDISKEIKQRSRTTGLTAKRTVRILPWWYVARIFLSAKNRAITFLDLPAEIRNTIYDPAISPNGSTIKRPALRPEDLNESAIAAVSRQVRKKALSINCASYIFQAEYLSQSVAFVTLIGPERAAMLTEFRACEWDKSLAFGPVRMQDSLDCMSRDRDCRLKGVREEAVFVPVAKEKWERLADSGQCLLWRRVRVVMLESSSG